MKHIIYIITALLLCTVSIQAQRRDFPALQITLQDGTKDTLFIGTNGLISMYGLNNATCEDYLVMNSDIEFSYGRFNFTYCRPPYASPYIFTSYGTGLGEGYGIIVSDKPIDDNKSIKEIGRDSQGRDCNEGGCLYINNDKEQWFYHYHSREFVFDSKEDNHGSYNHVLSLKYGETYYWRPFFLLDGKTYLGEEKAVRCPKLMSDILQRDDIWQACYGNVVFNNEEYVSNKLKTYYGNWSEYLDNRNRELLENYVKSMTEEQIAAAAVRTEVCDDGTLYFIDIPDSEVEKMIADIDKEGNTPFYVQGNNATTVFLNTKATKIVTCDEKWGVRDNQYITSDTLRATSSKPDIYVKLDHVMLPGKTYNITVAIAPQTDDTKEIKPLYMRFDILLKDYDDNTFTIPASNATGIQRLNVPGERLTADIIANGEALETITVQYTPQQFVYYNAFAVSHIKSFTTTNNRNKYEQNIRLVGVEVTPAE